MIFLFPLGGWRGGDRAIAVGGVGGVLGIGIKRRMRKKAHKLP